MQSCRRELTLFGGSISAHVPLLLDLLVVNAMKVVKKWLNVPYIYIMIVGNSKPNETRQTKIVDGFKA